MTHDLQRIWLHENNKGALCRSYSKGKDRNSGRRMLLEDRVGKGYVLERKALQKSNGEDWKNLKEDQSDWNQESE